MLYTVYTKYLNQEPTCHGTIECDGENAATIYAYNIACDIFSQHKDDEGITSFEDFHEALFSTIDFWIE